MASALPSICAGRSMLRPYGEINRHGGCAMDAGDEAAGGAAGIRRHQFGGLDLDVMDWAGACFRVVVGLRGRRVFGIGAVVRGRASGRVGGILARLALQREKSGFGLARGFERLAHGWIDVITPVDEWHGVSQAGFVDTQNPAVANGYERNLTEGVAYVECGGLPPLYCR